MADASSGIPKREMNRLTLCREHLPAHQLSTTTKKSIRKPAPLQGVPTVSAEVSGDLGRGLHCRARLIMLRIVVSDPFHKSADPDISNHRRRKTLNPASCLVSSATLIADIARSRC